jgi:predicted dithiol-disulfide oxidoreductase (DUF899 family)
VHLSELFADGKDTLFLYNFMFIPDEHGNPLGSACPDCTSIIDGIDGTALHLTQSINFAVIAKVSIERFRAHGKSRGWRHARLLSSANNTFKADYNAESPDGAQRPIATVFARSNGDDPPLLEQRARRCADRSGAVSTPRRLHVAALGDARPNARRTRHRLAPTARVLTDAS